MEDRGKLADQIWFTWVSRAKAEQRLIDKEKFVQFINIYYSLIAIICSIISYHYDDSKMGLFTIIITISLMVSILYLNGQKYLEQACDYRANYTQLHLLEMKVKDESYELMPLKEEYSKLLNVASNHIQYDYLKTLSEASEDYKNKYGWKHKKVKLCWERIWRLAVKTAVIFIPVLILAACEAWAK